MSNLMNPQADEIPTCLIIPPKHYVIEMILDGCPSGFPVETDEDYEAFCNRVARAMEVGGLLRLKRHDLQTMVLISCKRGMSLHIMPEAAFLKAQERMRTLQSIAQPAVMRETRRH